MSTCADNTHLRGAGGEANDDGQDRTRRADDDAAGVHSAVAQCGIWREASRADCGFNDLLRVVGHPDPIEVGDPDRFTFEKFVPGGSLRMPT